ncbi:hypothetical protein [Aminipila terrae]|uniref:Uncharacterized protein n=1 Tax=Aminipila terrae TaxID=2697030 RepID=A0A6P1MDH8_9FIRM|nr:hypothetical protein [Aminipila terrae]QHI72072.1 hypothetical protein Ami3637_06375 [Aminipila terrae]
MAKNNKQGSKVAAHSKQPATKKVSALGRDSDYFCSMSMAPRINEGMHWFQMLPAAFFTAFIIMIVRYYEYKRPMNQFYWTNSGNDLTEFLATTKWLLSLFV